MKKIYTMLFLSLVVLLSTSGAELYSQDIQLTDSEVTEDSFFALPQEDETEVGIVISQSALTIPVSLNMASVQLTDILDEISKQTNVSFIYGDNVARIDELTILVEDETIYKVLEKVLAPYDISFYEFEYGEIALASKQNIDAKTGIIQGRVKDAERYPLIGANVMLYELKIGCSTNAEGFFKIKNIRPGEYTFMATFVGYERFEKKIVVRAGEILELNIQMESEAFQIGGIEVTAEKTLIPTDVETKTVIESGEIEHYQASSIKDVLDLVPGVQKSDNPGLGKSSNFIARGDEDDTYGRFGTQVVVDGTPESNNADLQFERMTGSKFGSSTTGKGVDLRTIPADNIEKIEVITGLPSVKYGDVTSGIINIKSKIGAAPHRLKIKNNPNTSEGNIGGGFSFNDGSALSYNVNMAQSERDIRVTGDEYIRLTGQVVYSKNYFDNTFSNNAKFLYQRILDEEEPEGDLHKTRNYNRSYKMQFSTWGEYDPSDGVSTFEYNAYVTMRRENSMKSKLNQSDLRILPNGDTVSTYVGKVETKGMEWNIGGRLEWKRIFYTGEFIHKILLGTDPRYNVNTGEGLILDTLFNYYGADSRRRPYSFDDIPGQFLASIYFEDKITGHFIWDFSLLLGFRYEMYRPHKLNLSGLWGDGDLVESHNGTFFNPRMNLMVYLSEDSQFRISAGSSSKSPPMSSIYPPDDYFNWRNPNDSTTYYFQYNQQRPDLKGYKETMYEISYDHRFFNSVGTTISAFYKERSGQPEGLTVPVFMETSDGINPLVYYIDSYSLPYNTGYNYSKGLEFSIRTKKIEPLNMTFQVTGSYTFMYLPRRQLSFSANPDESLGRYPNYQVPGVSTDTLIGWWHSSEGQWKDYFQLNYYVRYTLAPLGIWITLRAEQVLSERRQVINPTYMDVSLLNETQLLDKDFREEIKTKPNKWLFSLNLSKSLFDGAEISFYVNNFLDDLAVYQYNSSRTIIDEEIRNPSLFYGIEFSMMVDNLFRGGK